MPTDEEIIEQRVKSRLWSEERQALERARQAQAERERAHQAAEARAQAEIERQAVAELSKAVACRERQAKLFDQLSQLAQKLWEEEEAVTQIEARADALIQPVLAYLDNKADYINHVRRQAGLSSVDMTFQNLPYRTPGDRVARIIFIAMAQGILIPGNILTGIRELPTAPQW